MSEVKCAHCSTPFEPEPIMLAFQGMFPDGSKITRHGEQGVMYQAPLLCAECRKSPDIIIEVNRRFLHALENPV